MGPIIWYVSWMLNFIYSYWKRHLAEVFLQIRFNEIPDGTQDPSFQVLKLYEWRALKPCSCSFCGSLEHEITPSSDGNCVRKRFPIWGEMYRSGNQIYHTQRLFRIYGINDNQVCSER